MEESANVKNKAAGRPVWDKIIRWVVFGLTGLTILLLCCLQIAMRPSVLKGAIDRYAAPYIDGSLSVGKVKASVIKRFPNASVTIEDLLVTYPHEKFAEWDSKGIDNPFRTAGAGTEGTDTLLSARKAEVEINLMKALKKEFHIGRVSLEKARAFAHMYDSTTANWNILGLSPSSGKDTADAKLPVISVSSLTLKENPLVVFTDIRDTLFGRLAFDNLDFKGRISTSDLTGSKVDFRLDSLSLLGRTPSDTVSLRLDLLSLKSRRHMMDVTLKAMAGLGLNRLGIINIPVEFTGNAGLVPPEEILGKKFRLPRTGNPLSRPAVSVRDMKLKVAAIELGGEADAVFLGDSTFLKAGATIDRCKVGDLISFLGNNIPSLKMFSTDAVVSADASCNGFLNTARGTLPDLKLSVKAPKSAIRFKGIDETGWMSLDISAGTGEKGRLEARLDEVHLGIPGLDIDLDGTGDDILGDDMRLKLDARVNASLTSLSRMIPDSLGITAEGTLSGKVKGNLSKKDLAGMEAILNSSITADLTSQGIKVNMPGEALSAYLGRTDITLSPSPDDGRLSLSANIDSVNATFRENMFIRGKRIGMDASQGKDGGYSGHLNLASVAMMDVDSTFLGSRNMRNTFRLSMDGGSPARIYFKTDNGTVSLRTGSTRVTAHDATLTASASEASNDKVSSRRKAFLDSLQRVYPGTPRDSLMRKAMRARRGRPLPDFLSDKDFAKKDIDLRLGESVVNLLKKWHIKGNIDVSNASVITPYYPLDNEVTGMKGSFDNNSIGLENLSVRSGRSDLSAKGSLKGLRRAVMTRRGMLDLDLNLMSEQIDVNEALAAFAAGSQYTPQDGKIAADEKLGDKEFKERFVTDSLPQPDSTANKLIVLPSNLNANISLQSNSVKYSSLDISWMAADIKLKERCLQATNALATSNLGDLYFEGFYSTKTKKDLKAGFDLTLVDVTADKVIELLPAVDSIMPMLKTFKGTLDCEFTATSALDTNMNLVMSTINGVMNIGGKNLSMSDNKVFHDLAKTLMFRNKEDWKVDNMQVNGIINDNLLEIFPFVLKVDRYTFALDGIQNFDESFKYHVSVLRSPIPFRFGINMNGNFEKWKWKIGKAKFKNTRVPVFTAQLDTMRINLTESIHNIFEKGVDVALDEVRKDKEKVDQLKEEMNYSADTETEALDEKEKQELEAIQSREEADEDTVKDGGPAAESTESSGESL